MTVLQHLFVVVVVVCVCMWAGGRAVPASCYSMFIGLSGSERYR